MLPSHGHLLNTQIFISHSHWDHVNALPFFSPLYIPGNHVTISGPANIDISVEKMISDQMSSIYFPVTVTDLGSNITYQNLHQGQFQLGNIQVSTMLLRHPGNCLGYRLDYNGRSVSYITDNELFPKYSDHYSSEYFDNLCTFVEGTDILITDTTYTKDEYKLRIGWGHSAVPEVTKLASKAKAQKLCLFHHDPSQADKDIDRKLIEAKQSIEEDGGEPDSVCAPKERDKFKI